MTYFMDDTGTYPVTLIASTQNGCMDTIEKKVYVNGVFYLNIPNAFTPNGDGVNDYFRISGIGLKDIRCIIFNRWGQKVYEWNGTAGYWDGNVHGKPAPEGVYYYVVEVTDFYDSNQKLSGYFHLFR